MKWISVVILACFFCVTDANASARDSKTIQITVNLLTITENGRAMRIELCKRAKYRDYPVCEEFAAQSSLSSSVSVSSSGIEDDSANGILPQVGTQLLGEGSQDSEQSIQVALMASMLTFSDEAAGNSAPQRVQFLSALLDLESADALGIAQTNDLFIDEFAADTLVTISGI